MAITSSPSGTTPAGISGQVNRTLLSDLQILKPQVFKEFVEKYGNQSYTALLEMLGKKEVANDDEFFHFESKGRLHTSVQAASVAYIRSSVTDISAFTPVLTAASLANDDTTIDAGEGVILTITSGSHFNSGTQSGLRVGEVLRINSTGIEGKIVAIDKSSANAHKAIVVPLKSTEAFSASANEWMLFRGVTEVGEKSSKSDSLQNLDVKVSNTVTEVREDWSITDKAKIAELWYEYDGKSYYQYKGLDQAVRRFMNNKEFKLIFGDVTTNTRLSNGSKGTRGLIPSVKSGGSQLTYSSFDKAAMHELTRQLDYEGGASEYHWLCDTTQRQLIDDLLNDTYKAGAINYGAAGGSDEIAKVVYGFASMVIDGYTFHFKKYAPFNAGTVYGAAAGEFDSFGLLCPMDAVKDSKTGDSISSVNIVYNLIDGQELKVWETGALAKTPTSDVMELNVHHLCMAGMRTAGLNRFAIIKKA